MDLISLLPYRVETEKANFTGLVDSLTDFELQSEGIWVQQ